ncbi:helix-turn-helix domain-containing protein [Novosphingobium cyanobacteriorum]|uniref:Helix-turn-helix domain-containing protein n=1 Tax=Novosphingobium cyanobacteriorum TaxID=3024215 RepID=A0ABT6CHQ5_9SPHN|nr:helix-turn-helix domain-containing protein [Novosphingobium cyanobacteriorum]MDF8333457.1 helix-turn-helix domain-containing protein [Novosphingobium cyanobacteriorum]
MAKGVGNPPAITRFALYGEGDAAVSPEFVHVERIFERSSRNDWTIEPHAHPGLLQCLLLQSGGVVLADEAGRRRERGPGVFVAPPGTVHAFRFTRGAEGWVLSIAADLLDDPRMAGFCGRLNLPQDAAAWIGLQAGARPAERLGWLLADLDGRLAEGEAGGGVVLGQVLLALAIVADAADSSVNPVPPDPRGRLATRFRALVDVHYREHWRVEDYAAALGTTRATLGRACRNRFGRAPAEIAHDRLLKEAQRLLAFSGGSVAEIADALGFADPAYFARFFKTRSGMTATAFRESRGRAG